MDKLTDLLSKLADKLGTTIEHLLPVLIKQAPISGTTDLMLCIVLIIINILLFKFIQKKTTLAEREQEGYISKVADWGEEGKAIAWVLLAGFFTISIIIITTSAEMIVSAFFNPEYWALHKILSIIK